MWGDTMNYEYYKIFYYVGKHKNISKAATELHSSQPAVSRVVQSMESELGCKLFVRNKNGVEFTKEGETLFEYVKIAQSQLNKGEEEVMQAVNAESGTVYVGTTVTALYGFLYDVMDEFRMQHPGIKIKINTGSSNGTVEKLKNGIFDIAFVSSPCKIPAQLNARNVGVFSDILIAGNKFTGLKGRTISLKEVSRYPFVSVRHSMQLRQFIDDFFAANNITVSPDIEADSADLLTPLIAHNFGIGFVPEDMARAAMQRGEVFKVQTEKEMPQRCIYMVTDPGHPHTNASRELSRAISRRLTNKNQ